MAVTLAELLILGLLADWLLRRIRCPGLVGMLAIGVLCGPFVCDLIAGEMLAISADLRLIALIVILLRAGLQIDRDALRRIGGRALLLAFLPATAEILVITACAPPLLGLTALEAVLLGTVIAAVSPAVVVPLMLRFIAEGRGRSSAVPTLVLAAASVDDVFVIVAFTATLGLYLHPAESGLAIQLSTIPVSILLGVGAGAVLGWLCWRLFRRFDPRATKRVLILLGGAILLHRLQMMSAGLVPFSALLAVMSAGFVLLELAPDAAHEISAKLAKIWILAEILLFTLVGAQVDIAVAWHTGLAGLTVIILGLIGRSATTQLCLLGSALNRGQRLLVTVAYLPKATVQAAIGGAPLLAMRAAGLPDGPGEIILAVAVLSIVITAPTGAWAIGLIGPRVLPVEADADAVATQGGPLPTTQGFSA